MPLELQEVTGNIVHVHATGHLTDDDYEKFVPRMEELIERWGRLRMLFEMDAFEGWGPQSAWEEFKFHAKHRKDLKRVAVVGEKTWEKWASRISRFFTGTDVRYFDRAERDEAEAWIKSGW